MNLVYADTPPSDAIQGPGIFLAGPTSRDDTPSWRPDAVAQFRAMNFTGSSFLPETEGPRDRVTFDEQVEWEWDIYIWPR